MLGDIVMGDENWGRKKEEFDTGKKT